MSYSYWSLSFMELSINQIYKAYKPSTTMELLDYEEILPHEMNLLSSEGVSLANFADRNNKKNIFTKNQSNSISDHHQFRMVNMITIKDSKNSNLQALVIAFLRCIYQNSKNSDLLDHMKCSLYNKTLTFSKLENVQLQSLSDLSIKKMLAQFFQLLTFGNYQNKVLAKLNKYPIVIELLICYFRVLLSCMDVDTALDGKNQLQTKQIYELLFQYFDVNFTIIDGIYLLLDDGIFISFKNQQFLVGDFIQNIKKKSEPSEDGCSSDEQLIAFVRPNDIQKNIMAINQIDEDFTEQQVGNSTPSFVPTQVHNFEKKRNFEEILENQEGVYQNTQSSTPSFNKINKEQVNFKPKVKINQCQAIEECDNEDDIPPQVRIRTRTIDVTKLWEANMQDSQGSLIFQSNHQSIVDFGENPQNTNLPLLDRSYRLHCEQKASKPQTPPPFIHKRNKSQATQQMLTKKQTKNIQIKQKDIKDIKPPPSFLFAPKKYDSPQKSSPQSPRKKDLLEVVKQQKIANDTNNKTNTKTNQKWLPFMYNKKKQNNQSYNNQKTTSQILEKKMFLNYNNTSNSYQKLLTSSRQHQCSTVCSKCSRKIPKNQIKSQVVSISIKPQSQTQKLYQLPLKKISTASSHSPSPKKISSMVNTIQQNFNMKRFYENQVKILTKTSAIYAVNSGVNHSNQYEHGMIHSSPITTNNPHVTFNYPKNFINRSHQGRTSAIYPPNSMYY